MRDVLLVETNGAVRVLSLNRPERLNALTDELFELLIAQLKAAETDADIRAILLTGTGRGFCAGADLMGLRGDEGHDLGTLIDRHYNPLTRLMRNCPKPIVCAVNGVAAGAGVNIALAADIVLAARSASFTQAFVKIGLLPDAGGTFFLPRIVGDAKARALALLGDTISADEACAIGMIWKVIDDESFVSESIQTALDLSAKPPRALAAIKLAFNASGVNSLDEQLDLERDLQRKLGFTEDFAEGTAAFKEKRPARFRGV